MKMQPKLLESLRLYLRIFGACPSHATMQKQPRALGPSVFAACPRENAQMWCAPNCIVYYLCSFNGCASLVAINDELTSDMFTNNLAFCASMFIAHEACHHVRIITQVLSHAPRVTEP